MYQKGPCTCKVTEKNTFHAKRLLGGRNREKEVFMYIIKYVSISRFSLHIGVSISYIFVALKKDYPIQLQFTET